MTRMRIIIFIYSIMIAYLIACQPVQGNGLEDPWHFDKGASKSAAQMNYKHNIDNRYVANVLRSFFSFYQHHISPMDGPKCPFYPTCSAYAQQALKRYGALWGTLMMADRLIREYPGMERANRYDMIFKGIWRYYDPIHHEYIFSPHLESIIKVENEGETE